MLNRLWDRFTYWVERRFVRGAQYRLLLVAALIGLISILGGAAVLALGSGFDRPAEAIWWAFLRLTDPGYLGDDVGTVNRIVSTVLTVLGYVVFLGALVAVMTQWLDHRMKRLEAGLTPVTRDGHMLVLGLNNRTHAIVREILLSEGRVRRFLRRHGTRHLHIVVLAEEVTANIVQDLRDAVGEEWDDTKVTLRSGTPLRTEHLERVDAMHASVIILPASEFEVGGADNADSFAVKTLLSLASERPVTAGGTEDGEWPFVVAEVFDERKVSMARRAYPGDIEILSSDAIVSRLLAQNVRHPELSRIYNDLLTHAGGAELYVRSDPRLEGKTFGDVAPTFRQSILLGVVRREEAGNVPYLNPPGDFVFDSGDRFVHLANSFAETEATAGGSHRWPRGVPRTHEPGGLQRRILILGWSHKVPALLHEFTTYDRESFEVVTLSTVPKAERTQALARYEVDRDRIALRQVEGDYAEVADLNAVDPASFDAVILLSSDRRSGAEESDARAILGSLFLEERGVPGRDTQAIIELFDPDNERLVSQSAGEVIISPLILSHMLAHVALRPQLGAVFNELFTAGGAEITFSALDAFVEPPTSGGDVSFLDIQMAAFARGEIALGVLSGGPAREVNLCPDPESRHAPDSRVVTLVTYA